MINGSSSATGLKAMDQPSPEKDAARNATRARADGRMRRYKARMERTRVSLIRVPSDRWPEAWERCLAWQLAWENEILRYRDGNNDVLTNGKDNDNG